MSELPLRNEKIVAKRQESSFDDFLFEIASRYPMMFYKHSGVVTIYPDTDRIGGVVPAEEFEHDRDILSSLDYDSHLSVFEHLWKLFRSIKFPHVHHFVATENGDYANYTSNVRNPYLSFHVTWDCDNVFYSLSTKIRSRNIYNSVMSWVDCENVYMSSCIVKWYNIFYSKSIENSANIWFSTWLIGCQECLFCNNFENQSYCIRNEQYTKEQYEQKKKELLEHQGSFDERHLEMLTTIWWDTSTMLWWSETENNLYSYNVHRGKNIVFCGHDEWLTDVVDTFVVSWGSNCAGACSLGGDSEYIYCCVWLRRSFNMYYSYFCEMCTYCFGCVWLKNKTFCIFNKQYTKEERYVKIEEIFEDMEQQWIVWDFLPLSINPFYINDTASYVTTDVTFDTVKQSWWLRREWSISVDIPNDAEIESSSNLWNYEHMLNSQWIVDDTILHKVIKDDEWKVYRILSTEYQFLLDNGLPLPRKHRLTRIRCHF